MFLLFKNASAFQIAEERRFDVRVKWALRVRVLPDVRLKWAFYLNFDFLPSSYYRLSCMGGFIFIVIEIAIRSFFSAIRSLFLVFFCNSFFVSIVLSIAWYFCLSIKFLWFCLSIKFLWLGNRMEDALLILMVY